MDVIGEKALDALIEYLADPSKLCTTLGFCSSQRHVLLLRTQPIKNIFHLSARQFPNPSKKVKYELSFYSMSFVELCLLLVLEAQLAKIMQFPCFSWKP